MKNRSYVWYHCIASLVLSVCHRRIAIGCSAIRRIMVSAYSNNFFVGFQYCSASIAGIRPADINMQALIYQVLLPPQVIKRTHGNNFQKTLKVAFVNPL